MMGKKEWSSYMANVLFPHMPQDLLCVGDSWKIYNDRSLIEKATPEGRHLELLQLPPGTTPTHQPLDVFFYGPYKGFMKKIEDRILLDEIKINLHARDNVFRLHSLVYNMFAAPKFEPVLRYCWYKAGYIDQKPEPFETPVQFCFGKLKDKCSRPDCERLAFLKCGHCELEICFDHFFMEITFAIVKHCLWFAF